jgi:CMP/dCMP kinase
LNISVAIDGPAGAGKSTIAKILASKLNLMYINTGSMYRAVTLKAIENNILPNNTEALSNLIDKLEMYFHEDNLYVNGEDITEYLTLPNISNNVSYYASIPLIRDRLVQLQRNLSFKYNVVMDGRDIGTVVLKDAPFKFFITASPHERAKRRYEELLSKGLDVDFQKILNELLKRDYNDTHRLINPLVKAEDAIEIDTTGLTIFEVVDKMYSHIKNVKL